jgi:hypothetical protein
MEENRNTYRDLMGKPDGKRRLERRKNCLVKCDGKYMGGGVGSRFIWLRKVSGGASITVIVILPFTNGVKFLG